MVPIDYSGTDPDDDDPEQVQAHICRVRST
jgi:hypothetical protein